MVFLTHHSGLVKYQMPQGNARGGRYNFTDSSYDGFTKNHFLSAGLGTLTDGKLAPKDYATAGGSGWIGWNTKDTPTPYIIFEFLNTRIFRSMTLHCNVRDRTKIKLFSKVVVSFNVDGGSFDASRTYEPESVSSGSSWMNYNVTIDLCQHIGKLMKLNFTYAGHWILISEVTFDSGKFTVFVLKRLEQHRRWATAILAFFEFLGKRKVYLLSLYCMLNVFCIQSLVRYGQIVKILINN